jgi:hypothetical protein
MSFLKSGVTTVPCEIREWGDIPTQIGITCTPGVLLGLQCHQPDPRTVRYHLGWESGDHGLPGLPCEVRNSTGGDGKVFVAGRTQLIAYGLLP